MRKVLSFVLVLSLVLGSFSMAFAATPASGLSDIDGIANEDAIQVSYDLGIVTGNPDGTFLPEKSVNRAEFAAMITRALAIPESALAGYTTTTFKDTAGYGWAVPYLAFAQSKGIMLGDGQGNAMPGRTINTNEAMTMALRAIGYTANSAELVGAWPSNYVTLAQNVRLYDDVAAVVSVDKANAAQIIYNLLTVQKVAVNSDGETKALTIGTSAVAATLLNTGLGATADAVARVLDGTESATINIKPYTGACVIAYEKDDEIIAIGEVKSTFLTGDYTSTAGILKVGSVEYKLPGNMTYGFDATVASNDIDGVSFDNADATSRIAGTVQIDSIYAAKTKITVAVELSNKTVKTLYSTAEWTVNADEVADAATLQGIEDKEIVGISFVQDDDKNIDLNSFELVGVASLDKIAKDNVVYVYAYGVGHEDSGKVAKVAVGTSIVSGKVTRVSGSDFTVDGKAYKLATENDKSDVIPAAGDDVKLFLDAYGKVYTYKSTDATADNYAVVFAGDNSQGIDGKRIRMMDAAEKEATYAVKSTQTVPSGPNTLIGYSLDKNGKVDVIDNIAVTNGTIELVSSKVLKIGATTHAINNDVVVFAYNGVDDYSVINISKVDIGVLSQANVSVAAILDGTKVAALLLDSADANKSSDDTYGVINDFAAVYDAEQDDKVNNLVGFADGAAFNKNTNDFSVTPDFANYATSAALFKVVLDGDGYIKSIEVTSTAVNGDNIVAVGNDKYTVQLVTTNGGVWAQIADKATVYQVFDNGTKDLEYKLSSVNSLRATTAATTYKIWLYDTDSDTDGYDIVMFEKL